MFSEATNLTLLIQKLRIQISERRYESDYADIVARLIVECLFWILVKCNINETGHGGDDEGCLEWIGKVD